MDNIELRSEKVRNIVGRMPNFFVRYGISVIFFVLLSLTIVTMIIPYKETITIQVRFNPSVSCTKATARITYDKKVHITKGMLFSANIFGETCTLRLDSISEHRIDGRYLSLLTLAEGDVVTQQKTVNAIATFSNGSYFEKLTGITIIRHKD